MSQVWFFFFHRAPTPYIHSIDKADYNLQIFHVRRQQEKEQVTPVPSVFCKITA